MSFNFRTMPCRLLLSAFAFAIAAHHAAADCSATVSSALAQVRMRHGHVMTGTSREQPAIVMPIAQLPYIPNIRFRMTLAREGGGGTLHWQMEWTQPYAVEVTNRTIASGHVIIENAQVDWQGKNCSDADMERMQKIAIGVMAGVCVQMHGEDGGPPAQQCFQDTGHADMLLLRPLLPHAPRESYEFFMFFHFVVRPFCRETVADRCWGFPDLDLGAFHSLQQRALYKFEAFFDFSLSDCSMASCRQLQLHGDDVAFYAAFHAAPGHAIAC